MKTLLILPLFILILGFAFLFFGFVTKNPQEATILKQTGGIFILIPILLYAGLYVFLRMIFSGARIE
jgi:hypothetical protein